MFSFQFNLSHHIRHLSFGHEYPGIKHPLDDTYISAEDGKFAVNISPPFLYYLLKLSCTIHFKVNASSTPCLSFVANA